LLYAKEINRKESGEEKKTMAQFLTNMRFFVDSHVNIASK
jgi:hypothetical protein